jgi:hypothetical protein
MLAEFAADHGDDLPLLIRSHGETYGVGGFSWDPREGAVALASLCPYDAPFAALSLPDSPETTAQFHHDMAEKLAVHLEEVAASIRATYQGARYKRMFALQQQAIDIGDRHISTGGGYTGTAHYGMVTATCLQESRIAGEDSWRCHHEHPDDLTALECALGEVRRLADGGAYEPCSTGPECEDELCRLFR